MAEGSSSDPPPGWERLDKYAKDIRRALEDGDTAAMGEELETPVSRLLALDVEGASLQPHVADALRLAQYALRGSEAVHSAEVKRLNRRLERAADSGDAERRLRDATEELRTLKDELAERREELTEMQEQLDAAEARGAGEASGDYGGGGAAVQKLRLKNTALQEDLDDVRLRNKDLLKDLARKEEREEDLRRDLDKLRTRTREEGDEKRQMEEDLRAYKEQARGPLPPRHRRLASNARPSLSRCRCGSTG